MTRKNIKLAVATSFEPTFRYYIKACKELNIDYELYDIFAPDWLEFVKNHDDISGYLLRPPSSIQERKSIHDERVYFINKILNKPVYPGFDELFIYENKRNMAAWLEANDFPHPKTRVFVHKKDALEFVKNAKYPLVFKANIGYGSKGVKIVRNSFSAQLMIHRLFGIFHHKTALGLFPWATVGKQSVPIPHLGRTQKHNVIIQEYKKIKWEWRIIKIGRSYFGRKKLLVGDFASGSKKFGWEDPPKELFDLVREVTAAGNFYSMSLDIFETVDGEYLINELQSLFGSKNDFQMKVNNKKGRYLYNGSEYTFEEGKFSEYGTYRLRVKHFVKMLENNTL